MAWVAWAVTVKLTVPPLPAEKGPPDGTWLSMVGGTTTLKVAVATATPAMLLTRHE